MVHERFKGAEDKVYIALGEKMWRVVQNLPIKTSLLDMRKHQVPSWTRFTQLLDPIETIITTKVMVYFLRSNDALTVGDLNAIDIEDYVVNHRVRGIVGFSPVEMSMIKTGFQGFGVEAE